MARRLTMEQRANRLYRFVHCHYFEHARGPSHREMARRMGWSAKTLQVVLARLKEEGRLIRIRARWRRLMPITDVPEGEE